MREVEILQVLGPKHILRMLGVKHVPVKIPTSHLAKQSSFSCHFSAHIYLWHAHFLTDAGNLFSIQMIVPQPLSYLIILKNYELL